MKAQKTAKKPEKRGRGRPKSADPRSRTLAGVRLTAGELEQVRTTASEHGLTLAAWVRGKIGI